MNSIPLIDGFAAIRASQPAPGWYLQWFTPSGKQEPGGEYCVVHRCHNHHDGTLGVKIHAIDADGTVKPSVVCNHVSDGCTYHEHVQLLDWKEPENAKRVY